jgi:preprotein translocase subunit SecE
MGDFIMSETEYSRLDAKLDKILEFVGRTDQTLRDYPEIRDMVLAHDTAVETIQKKCAFIQTEKQVKRVSWGTVKTSIIVGIIVFVVTTALNVLIDILTRG